MRRFSFSLAALAMLTTAPAGAQQQESYDYFRFNRDMVQHGVQAVLMCNGLFTSNRTLEQVFQQELAYVRQPVGTARGGDYVVDWDRKAVAIGAAGGTPTMRAAFRKGLGCVIMAPDQTFEDIASLPILDEPPPPGDPATIAWPNGDLLDGQLRDTGIDWDALQASADWSFERESPEQVTLSLLVVHRGQIVLERYAEGVDMHTRTRTWSTAKSIGVTLIGILAGQGKMHLDRPLDLEWLPRYRSPETDPRNAITLRHVLNMSSGLYPVDSRGMEYATGSGLAYWAGASSINGARNRALIREPGTYWDYENYDTLLAILAMKQVWTQKDAEFHGEYFDFDPVWSEPKPVQKPHPPIYIGASSKWTIERVVEYADGWMPIADPALLQERLTQMDELCAEKGRDRSEINVSVFGGPPSPEEQEQYEKLGVDRLILGIPTVGESEVLAVLDSYAPVLERQ